MLDLVPENGLLGIVRVDFLPVTQQTVSEY